MRVGDKPAPMALPTPRVSRDQGIETGLYS
jgi:hypothetical protein